MLKSETAHSGMSIVTLGVAAGPAIRSNEYGISTAIVVDDVYYLVDFGLGCTRAANAAGLVGQNFRAGFITHLHSDHVVELPGFLMWNWGNPVKGFTKPIHIIGPGQDPSLTASGTELAGTQRLVESVLDAFSYDFHIRIRDEGRPDLRELIQVQEVALPSETDCIFPVYEDDLIRVTGVLVDHPPVFPAMAFRIDSKYGSVTVSGDTRESPNLVALATDTDVLIHEAVNLDYYTARGFDPAFINHQRLSHSTPRQAGRVAHKSGAGSLILSHLAGIAPSGYWEAEAATEFTGPIMTAHSGMVHAVVPSLASR